MSLWHLCSLLSEGKRVGILGLERGKLRPGNLTPQIGQNAVPTAGMDAVEQEGQWWKVTRRVEGS